MNAMSCPTCGSARCQMHAPCIEGCPFGAVLHSEHNPTRTYSIGHDPLCPNALEPDPPERFDEHAADLDAWRADQARLKVAEDAAFARLDSAFSRLGLPARSSFRPDRPVALSISPFQVAHEERRAARADLEELIRCARAVGEAFDAPRTRLALAVNALLEAADTLEAGRLDRQEAKPPPRA